MRRVQALFVAILVVCAMALPMATPAQASTCDRGGPCDQVLAIVFNLTCKTAGLFCNIT